MEETYMRKPQICFQGNKMKKNYFEGWYYKMVTADKKVKMAVIVGICTREHPHAFIQMIETVTGQSYYFPYDLDAIIFQDEPFSIQIDDNYFSKDQLILNLHNDTMDFRCNLFFSELTPLKKTWFAPTIMGPFSYFPMKCAHGIMSMHHYIDGSAILNGKEIDFEDGYGYSEKDYGTSFPKQYLWAQSNTLKKESRDFRKVSVMLAIADVPFGLIDFRGFLCVLQINHKQYRFTTYNHSKLTYRRKKHGVIMVELKRGNDCLTMHLKPGTSYALKAPIEGAMKENINESLDGVISIVFKQNRKTVFKQQMIAAGMEEKKEAY